MTRQHLRKLFLITSLLLFPADERARTTVWFARVQPRKLAPRAWTCHRDVDVASGLCRVSRVVRQNDDLAVHVDDAVDLPDEPGGDLVDLREHGLSAQRDMPVNDVRVD